MAFQQAIELDKTRLHDASETKKEARIRFSLGKTSYPIGNRHAAEDAFSKVRAVADARTHRRVDNGVTHQQTLEENFPVRP